MGSMGDAYDNVMCERFFTTLECELLDRQRLRTQADARLDAYRKTWYASQDRGPCSGISSI